MDQQTNREGYTKTNKCKRTRIHPDHFGQGTPSVVKYTKCQQVIPLLKDASDDHSRTDFDTKNSSAAPRSFQGLSIRREAIVTPPLTPTLSVFQ